MDLSDATLEEARDLTLHDSWRADLKRLSDQELAVEREYISRLLAEAELDPSSWGDSIVPIECWRLLYAERIAWLDSEVGKRQRIQGMYRQANTGFTGEYVENVKRGVDLAEFIVWQYPDTKLKWYGGRTGLLGFCPWHYDRSHKSLGVWPKPEWHWFCWVCLEGGDVYNWLLKRDAQGFRQAVLIAAGYAGASPPAPQFRGAVRL